MGSITAHWSLDPSLIYVAVSAVMYVVGGMRPGTSRSRTPKSSDERLHELAFAAGLASIVIALDSPIDYYSEQLFWVHMGQHIILLTVAPPLILTLASARWTAPIRAIARPASAFILFNGNMLLWHIPAAYNLTLNHQWI